MKKRKYEELEYLNNVEIPQKIDKQNIIIELLTWLGIIAVVLMTLYSLQTLWIVIRYYYLNN